LKSEHRRKQGRVVSRLFRLQALHQFPERDVPVGVSALPCIFDLLQKVFELELTLKVSAKDQKIAEASDYAPGFGQLTVGGRSDNDYVFLIAVVIQQRFEGGQQSDEQRYSLPVARFFQRLIKRSL
jgi:hypothetical protein